MTRPLGAYLYAEKTLAITKTPTDSRRLGVFEGYLSTWTIDRDNERFARGAFQQSIVEWLASGDLPPILYSHDRKNPENVVGVIESMHEDEEGLRVTGRLNLRAERAQRIYEAMLGGALKSMSVGFIAHEWRYDENGTVRVFERAEILEASLTPVPTNPRARVLAVKQYRSQDPEVARYRARIEELAQRSRTPAEKSIDRMRDELIADVRRERQERERIARLVAINADRARRMAGGPTLAEELAADEERYRREVAALAERDAHRAAEAEERERVAETRRHEGTAA